MAKMTESDKAKVRTARSADSYVLEGQRDRPSERAIVYAATKRDRRHSVWEG
jgi:hypothetical protein